MKRASASIASLASSSNDRAVADTVTADFLVFVSLRQKSQQKAGTIAEIETDILSETGILINALPLQAGSYRELTGLMQELRRDGLDL